MTSSIRIGTETTEARQRRRRIRRFDYLASASLLAFLGWLVIRNIDVVYLGGAGESSTLSECEEIHELASEFLSVHGWVPTLDDLLRESRDSRTAPGLTYDEDPWGTPFEIRPLGDLRFEVISSGSDTIEDTEDDIVYPERD
ncbi:MAG: hypothetical protein AAF196_01870 [Planctomycetota bacterium]